jgi:hypothetical protein
MELIQDTNDVAAGHISLDRYLPGWCNWGFTGAWYSVVNGKPEQAELLFEGQPRSPVVNARLDFWCIRPTRNPELPEVCLDIRALGQQFPEQVSAKTVATIVATGGGSQPPINIDRGMKSLILQFHDLDAAGQDVTLRDKQFAAHW